LVVGGAPVPEVHQPRLHRIQPGQQRVDLRRGTVAPRDPELVDRFLEPGTAVGVVADHLREGQVAAGNGSVDHPVQHGARVGLVEDVVADGTEQHRDRFAEVDHAEHVRVREDRLGVAHVGADDHGRVVAGQRRAGVGEHGRVDVDVRDARVIAVPPRHLVHVVVRGQPAAHVEELPDPRLFGQVADGSVEEAPVLPGDVQAGGEDLERGLHERPVDGEVLRTAEQPAVGAGGRRDVGTSVAMPSSATLPPGPVADRSRERRTGRRRSAGSARDRGPALSRSAPGWRSTPRS